MPLSDVSRLFHCYAIPQSSNTSNSHKMVYSHHFIPFSLFGVSISINCLFVQAQTQFILLTLTSSDSQNALYSILHWSVFFNPEIRKHIVIDAAQNRSCNRSSVINPLWVTDHYNSKNLRIFRRCKPYK